jgi:hypothetical protein
MSKQDHKTSFFDAILKDTPYKNGSDDLLLNNLLKQMKDNKVKLIITPGIMKACLKKDIKEISPLINVGHDFPSRLPILKTIIEDVLRIMAKRNDYPISDKISKIEYLDERKYSIKIIFENNFQEFEIGKQFYSSHLVKEDNDIYLTICFSRED